MAVLQVQAPSLPRLLISAAAPESLACHLERIGEPPQLRSESEREDMISRLDRSGLRGRGGAGFPVGTKWRSVAVQAHAAGRAVVLINAAEGEPASAKDRLLVASRPHLILDGAVMAARAVGAGDVIVYIGREMAEARRALDQALHERRSSGLKEPRIRVVEAPDRYVAGEESAAVHRVNGGDAKPTLVPPRPFERGVRGMPTLVQNVESLAHAALIGRFGDAWFRSIGTPASPGSCLVTVWTDGQTRVREAEFGATLGHIMAEQGMAKPPPAVLLGGYFGAWLPWARAANLALEYDSLRAAGAPLGCGVILALPEDRCGLAEGARILSYLADETAGQCGPCVHGVRAMANMLWRLAFDRARTADVAQIERWAQQVIGRGACRHPDGAVGMMRSCLATFAGEVQDHVRNGPCSAALHAPPLAPIPDEETRWR